jgi:hypothetical protein
MWPPGLPYGESQAWADTVHAIRFQKKGLTNRVLIDTSVMTGWPSRAEMWYLVESYPQLEVPRETRLAAIRPQLPDDTDLSGFYETVCENRGYHAKAFDNRAEAERWLQEE